jgi:hypothetical protein
MTAIELLPPNEAVHGNDRWYELRRQGITASEIAIVLGISPYGSPFSLYWQKLNDWRDDGNAYTSAGRHLEDAIADWWMAECDPLENLFAVPGGLYAHRERPWQLATPDRLLHLPCPECQGGTVRFMYGCPKCFGSMLSGPPPTRSLSTTGRRACGSSTSSAWMRCTSPRSAPAASARTWCAATRTTWS